MHTLVSTAWLAENIGQHSVRVLDASWHMPAEHRDAFAEYKASHISGAQFVDIDALSDTGSPYPHMLPTPDMFAAAMSSLGIRNEDHIVVYDTKGLFSAARLWWMLRVFGHDAVSVLDGGLPKWLAEGRKAVSGMHACAPSAFMATYRPELVKTLEQVKQAAEKRSSWILDARSAARFSGEAPEPRAGLRSGHIPGSQNLPFAAVLQPPYQELLGQKQLAAIFATLGISADKPIIASCGSGVTACVLALALHELGHKDVAVYDGSWAEWGAREDVPVSTLITT